MVVCIEICYEEVVIIKYNQDAIFIKELPKITSVLFIIDAFHVGIKPHFPTAERRMA